MTSAPRSTDYNLSPHLLAVAVDNAREGQQRHPMAGPSDAEKYRWIRSNRGNVGIVDALLRCDKDTEFDDRIAAEMAVCAAGVRSYQPGPGRA